MPRAPTASSAGGSGGSQQQRAGGGAVDQQKAREGGSGGFQLRPLSYSLTMPQPDDYYFVREDQLENLTHVSKDYSLEIALFAGGAALGLLQNFVEAARSLYDGKAPSATDSILAAVAIVFTVLAIVKFFQFKSGANSVDVLKNKIKSGQKAVISNGH